MPANSWGFWDRETSWQYLGLPVAGLFRRSIDAFVMVQYKHLMPDKRADITDTHVFAGGMFHF